MSVKESQFRWTAGEEHLARNQASPRLAFQRTLCPRCGASGPQFAGEGVSVPAGWLDADSGIRPSGQIFTAPEHNVPWFEITDGMLCFEEGPSNYF